jgi:hypothetical protein
MSLARHTVILALFIGALDIASISAFAADAPLPDLVVGTQTFGVSYQFTRQPKLVETAKAIAATGSDIIKFSLSSQENSKLGTLTDIARDDTAVKSVLDMPFAYELLWAYAPETKVKLFQPETLPVEYKEIYDLTRYLLTTYAGTGKTFYLGNWEGDWHLTATGHKEPSPQDVANMIAWINIRQKAVDDAKRAVPHKEVNVFYYLELNLVIEARQGKTRLANAVLPHTPVDYVSYSSYDTLLPDPDRQLRQSLDYLQSQLPAKSGMSGKRVFIGEFGFPASGFSPQQQDDLSRKVMKICLEWGCPFVLYWEIYNNEIDHGRQKGYWMIDDHNRKQPIYYTIKRYYEAARAFVKEFAETHGRTPSQAEFAAAAVAFLQ